MAEPVKIWLVFGDDTDIADELSDYSSGYENAVTEEDIADLVIEREFCSPAALAGYLEGIRDAELAFGNVVRWRRFNSCEEALEHVRRVARIYFGEITGG